jgi:hypothetical protein
VWKRERKKERERGGGGEREDVVDLTCIPDTHTFLNTSLLLFSIFFLSLSATDKKHVVHAYDTR